MIFFENLVKIIEIILNLCYKRLIDNFEFSKLDIYCQKF